MTGFCNRALRACASSIRRYSSNGVWVVSVFLCFELIGELGIYAKLDLMDSRWYSVARWLGHAKGEELPTLLRLSFFAHDIVIGLLLMPLAAALLLGWQRHRLRVPVAASIFVVLLAAIVFQIRSRHIVGEYVSVDLMREAVTFGTHNPALVAQYVPLPVTLKVAVLLMLGLGVLIVGSHIDRQVNGQISLSVFAVHRKSRGKVLLAGMLLLLLGAGSAADRAWEGIPRNFFDQSALWIMAQSIGRSDTPSSPELKGRTYAQMVQFSRVQTDTAVRVDDRRYIGSMAGANVLLFVIETGPSRVFDLSADDARAPGVAELIGHSFVGNRHFTSFPYTSDAVFSIMSGLYPRGRRQLLDSWHDHPLPGLMTTLAKSGYDTAVFAPSLYGAEVDDRMYRAFGARTVFVANALRADARNSTANQGSGLYEASWAKRHKLTNDYREVLTEDDRALAALERFISHSASVGMPFAALFLPQASHAPWRGEGTVRERGRAQMRMQALALERLIAVIRNAGQLEKTIVVLTADHGIRTVAEDPDLPAGMATSYSFQVPLLIYAPRAISESVKIEAPTSHIDIPSTILALLGSDDTFAIGQGLPIWQASSRRRIYFLGESYGGYNGFTQDSVFYMRQSLGGQSYVNRRELEFSPTDLVDSAGQAANAIAAGLDVYATVQRGFMTALSQSDERLFRNPASEP